MERSLVTELIAETDAHEGPVYAADEHALYFTSVGGTEIRRLDLASRGLDVVRAGDDHANGMTMGPDGRLLVCLQGSMTEPARIAAVDRRTGETETVVDAWRGRPLNSPNDVIVASDGAIWFTDPSYGWLQGFRPQPQLPDQVYRYDGELHAAARGFVKPNGLAFSPDERTLYVGDSETSELWALDRRGGRRRFAAIANGYPDGLKADRAGRVYTTSADGVQIFDPGGALLDEIPLPGAVNFAFGRDFLFITSDTAVWAARGA
jgi:gluconolactonase